MLELHARPRPGDAATHREPARPGLIAEPTFARKKAGALQRLLLGSTPYVYHGPFAELLQSRCVLVLTTRGRKTGLPRKTAVSFMPSGDRYVVFAGFRGINAGWYRNLRENPHVGVRIGRRQFQANAELVADPQRRRDLMLQMAERSRRCGPPQVVRPILKVLRLFDYQREIDMALAAGDTLPVVEITPLERE